MSLFVRSHRLPIPDEVGPAPDGPPADQDVAAGDRGTDDGVGGGSDGAGTVGLTEAEATGDGTAVPADLGGGPAPDGAVAPGGWRARHPVAARAVAWTTTALAGALVLAAFLLPNRLPSLGTTAFLRLPVEMILLCALLVVLPTRARHIVGALSGVGIALLTFVKVLDMGFFSILGTPFDLMFDWSLISDGVSAFSDSVGHTTTVLVVTGVVVLVLCLLVLMPLAVVRLGNVMSRHTRPVSRSLLVLGVIWIVCSVLVVRIPGGPQFATRNTGAIAYENAQQVRSDIKDLWEFKRTASHDPFAATPPGQLLTGLRGKNVIFAFVESYGRCAVQDAIIAPGVNAMLSQETAKLQHAGFSSRSAFLTSATYGGSSWLGHSTFLSGLWVSNEARYRTVTHSSRMTLTAAFKRTGAWRTVGIVPGTSQTWPEAKWEGLDHVYDNWHLGYQGPRFSWSSMPDQYALSAFQNLENGRPHDKPLMSEIVLTSSHWPWAPIPTTIPWNQLGDGSVFGPIEKAGKRPSQVWRKTLQVRAEYGRSIQYTVSNLVDFVLRYGDKNTVLVFLGDHQPAAIVSGDNANHDVPISIVSQDPDVMKRISGWGWQDGLQVDPKTAPVWKMSDFRDRFLTAYGPQSGPASSPSR